MTESNAPLQLRFRIVAYLLILGLSIESITLSWSHPTSFLLFLGLGAVLVFLGIAIYLLTIVRFH